MGFRVGVDVGGTFTDFFVVDGSGEGRVYKTLSTPDDPTIGVLDGLSQAAVDHDLDLRAFLKLVEVIVHGTTITTNATLTGSGAKTGFITTSGFRDILNMRRSLKERQNDSKYAPPPPLVPRWLIRPVGERVDCTGQELRPLDENAVRDAAAEFRAAGIEAIAVSFLWSFANPAHETRVGEILNDVFPEAFVSLSSTVLPEIRAYERHSTTVLNAYVGPPLAKYLESLQEQLARNGFEGVLLVFQSNGGVMSPEIARRLPVNTLLSGPAAGPGAALEYGRPHGLTDIISIDMGGTSVDVSLVRGGVPEVTTEGEVNRYRVAVPMLDIHTIGAGGGSIAWIDSGGILRVGPQSAGVTPGPACYGRGGAEATVTDADLVLGYLDPKLFYSGKLVLDANAARQAIEAKVARPLGLDVVEAAHGIYRVVNAAMAAAVSLVTVKRGYDPREFALLVAGGAGPIHTAVIAEELGISTVLIPRDASVFCAVGMLLADMKHAYVRTYASVVDGVDLNRITTLYAQMENEAHDALQREGAAADDVVLVRSADLRYVGQFHEVEVPAFHDGKQPSETDLHALVNAFHERHEALYGHHLPDSPVELINLRLVALGKVRKPAFRELPSGRGNAASAQVGSRHAYFGGEFREVPVYDGLRLGANSVLRGPALVDHPTTSVVVTPAFSLACDQYGNYRLDRTERENGMTASKASGQPAEELAVTSPRMQR